MPYLKWIIAGTIGAAIGTIAWIVVGYFGYEVGWIAWGVGFLAGLGVRVVAGEENEGAVPGVIAAVIAIIAVLIGKYCVASILVNSALAEIGDLKVTDMDVMIAQEADAYAEELSADGTEVKWPKAAEDEDALLEDQYPAEVWTEGERRWHALSKDEQQDKIGQHEEFMASLMGELVASTQMEVFKESFTPWDFLWFGLALVTAFRVGSATYTTE